MRPTLPGADLTRVAVHAARRKLSTDTDTVPDVSRTTLEDERANAQGVFLV